MGQAGKGFEVTYPVELSKAFSKCSHPRVERVLNGNGVAIGRQCSLCLSTLSAVGTCSACGKAGSDLRVRVGGRLFCDDSCRKAGETQARKEAQARRKAHPSAAVQTEMPWGKKAGRK